MSLTMVTRNIFLTARARNRLIKFRYGSQNQSPSSHEGTPQHGSAAASLASKTSKTSQEAIWDFQIPARWKRAPISEEECAVINNGGLL